MHYGHSLDEARDRETRRRLVVTFFGGEGDQRPGLALASQEGVSVSNPPRRGGSRSVPGVFDAGSLVWILAVCVGHGFGVFLFDSYTPRMALLLCAGLPGLVAVARSGVRGSTAGRLAVALLVWIVIAALLSGAPLLALKGTIGRESSGLIAALCIGVWGVGRAASECVVRLATPALLVGLGFNAVLGFVQVIADITSGPFALQLGRAAGFTPNPVYFGALVAAGAAVSASNVAWRLRYRLASVVGFGAAVNLSGSRVALIAGFIGVVVAVLQSRAGTWRQDLLRPLAYVVGVGGATLLTAALPSARTSTDRIGSGGGGRLQAWRYGIDAVIERPITGWGLGRFRAATQERFSAKFVRTAAFDDFTQAWFDAHNIVVGVAVGLGLLGLVIATIWLFAACRALHGPLVPGVIVFGIVMLLQPAGLVVLPLALLLIGLATERARVPRRDSVSGPALGALLVGVLMAAYLTVADLRLDRAIETGDAEELAAAAAMYPRDSVVADLVAQSYFFDVRFGDTVEAKFREWSERSISAEPDRPFYRSSYALRLIALEDYAAARTSAEAAVELQPWHVGGWVALGELAQRTGDERLADRARDRLEVLTGACEEIVAPGDLC